jgi:hypothetical protein
MVIYLGSIDKNPSKNTLPAPKLQAPAPKQTGPVKYVITFYRNGIFTVNDGPPRRIDDPANASFIRSISVVGGFLTHS